MENSTLPHQQPSPNAASPVVENDESSIELDGEFFQQIPNVLLNQVAKGVLNAADIAVYMAFKAHVGDNPYAWPSNIRICKLTGLSKGTLRKSMRRLENAGHIHRQPKRGGTWHTYLLTTVKGQRAVCGKPQAKVAPRTPILAPKPLDAAPRHETAPLVQPRQEPRIKFGSSDEFMDEDYFAG